MNCVDSYILGSCAIIGENIRVFYFKKQET